MPMTLLNRFGARKRDETTINSLEDADVNRYLRLQIEIDNTMTALGGPLDKELFEISPIDKTLLSLQRRAGQHNDSGWLFFAYAMRLYIATSVLMEWLFDNYGLHMDEDHEHKEGQKVELHWKILSPMIKPQLRCWIEWRGKVYTDVFVDHVDALAWGLKTMREIVIR